MPADPGRLYNMDARCGEMRMTGLISKTLAASLGILAIAGFANAQKNQFPFDDYRVEDGLTIIHVQGNVYMIHGAGGNVAVQVGDTGVLVVNTGLAQSSEKLIAAIGKL